MRMEKMTASDWLSLLSLIIGLFSIVLAIFSMVVAGRAEARSKKNFDDTQAMVRQFYDGTKDLLNQIEKRTSMTEVLIVESHTKLQTQLFKYLDRDRRQRLQGP